MKTMVQKATKNFKKHKIGNSAIGANCGLIAPMVMLSNSANGTPHPPSLMAPTVVVIGTI
jgi:hypothetical protein